MSGVVIRITGKNRFLNQIVLFSRQEWSKGDCRHAYNACGNEILYDVSPGTRFIDPQPPYEELQALVTQTIDLNPGSAAMERIVQQQTIMLQADMIKALNKMPYYEYLRCPSLKVLSFFINQVEDFPWVYLGYNPESKQVFIVQNQRAPDSLRGHEKFKTFLTEQCIEVEQINKAAFSDRGNVFITDEIMGLSNTLSARVANGDHVKPSFCIALKDPLQLALGITRVLGIDIPGVVIPRLAAPQVARHVLGGP